MKSLSCCDRPLGRGIVVLLAGLVVLSPLALGVAFADTHAVIDRDDSPGPLDIAAAQHGHAGRMLTFDVVTYEAWDPSTLTGSLFLFRINLDSDKRLERGIVVRPGGDGLEARVFGKGGEVEGFRGYAQVTRPDDHSFRIELKRRLLKRDLESFAWQLLSNVAVNEPPCDGESGGCFDYVPRARGFIEHRLD